MFGVESKVNEMSRKATGLKGSPKRHFFPSENMSQQQESENGESLIEKVGPQNGTGLAEEGGIFNNGYFIEELAGSSPVNPHPTKGQAGLKQSLER